MNPFFDWIIKSSVSLALLYLAFKLAVSRDKIFTINRFVLLGVLAISAVLPLMDIPVFQETVVIPKIDVIREFVATPVISNTSFAPKTVSTEHESASMNINLWMVFYLLVILALLIRLLISVFRVLQIIKRAEKQPFQKIILAIVKDFIQPFSFLQHIVISEKDFTENKDIVIAHEYAHIKHFHAIDLLICELFTAIHWFNPFMWLLRHDLKLIHEYQADQAVLNKGIDAKKYQLLVLKKAVGERRFAMANYFTQKPILKRIKMMHRKNENYWKGVKLILFVPVVILLLQAFARPEILVEKAKDFVPAIQLDETKEWLGKWTIENIGNDNLEPIIVNFLPEKDNDVLVILINRHNEFLIENQYKTKDDVRNVVKNFLNGISPDGKSGPDYTEIEIPFIGKKKVSNGAISVFNDLDTSDELINFTLKNIGEAYLEARKEKAENLFGEDYFELDDDKQEAIDLLVPTRFSLNPKSTRIQLKPPPPPPRSNIIELTLRKDGKVLVGKDEYSIAELEQKIAVLINEKEQMYKKYNVVPEIITSVKIEVGVTDQQVSALKEVLRKAKIQHVNYSTDFKESEWKDQSSSEQSKVIIKEIEQKWDEIEKNLFASNRGIIRIGNNSYQLDRSILANESLQNSGKFEFDIFTTEDNKKVNIYFSSIRSLSQFLPDIGKYEYVSKSYSLRNENTFWGTVKIDDKKSLVSKEIL